jgi:hypothetical protein
VKNTENLKVGNPGNRGGSGRPKEEFLEWCRQLTNSPKARAFVQAMIEGDPIEEKQLISGSVRTIHVSAPAVARLKALEFVAAYGHGKPSMTIEAGEVAVFPLTVVRPELKVA